MKKIIETLLFTLISVGSFFLLTTQVSFAAPNPPVSTLPLDGLVHSVGDGSLHKVSDTIQYIQVTPAQTSKTGAVWFNDPIIDFSKDFDVEMYIYIQSSGTGDGMGVLLKDSRETKTFIGQDKAGSLGFLGKETLGYSDNNNTGAIPATFAIEFDNYYNDGRMDKYVSKTDSLGQGGHVAYSYPGINNSYESTNASWLFNKKDNVLKHNAVQYTPLATGVWRKFTMKYQKATNTLKYQLYGVSKGSVQIGDLQEISVPNFVGGDPNVKETFPSGKAYLGFAGATGQDAKAIQEMAVTFTKAPSVLDIGLKEQVSLNNQVIFDSDQGGNPSLTLTKRDSILDYKITADYKTSSSLQNIGVATFSVDAPETLKIDENTFKINGQPVATVFYNPDTLQYQVTSASEFTKGKQYTLTYQAHPNIPKNGNFDQFISANVQVTGKTFGLANLASKEEDQDLGFSLVSKVAFDTQINAVQVKGDGTKETILDTSKDVALDPLSIDSQQEKIQVTVKSKISEDTTFEDVGNLSLELPLSTMYTLNKDSLKLDPSTGFAIASSDKDIIVTGTTPFKKGDSLTISFELTPIMLTDKTNSGPTIFKAQTIGEIGSSEISKTIGTSIKSTPIIKIDDSATLKDLKNQATKILSQHEDAPLQAADQDQNSSVINYFIADLGANLPAAEYQPTDKDTQIGTHENRSILNEGSAQVVSNLKIPVDYLSKLSKGKHYFALYAKDKEGNISEVHYLSAEIVTDTLELTSAPNLNFIGANLYNANDIARVGSDYTIDYPLQDFQLKNKLRADDNVSSNNDKIIVTDSRINSQSWHLNVAVTEIESLIDNEILDKNAAIILTIGLKNSDKTVDLLYGLYKDEEVDFTLEKTTKEVRKAVKAQTILSATGDPKTAVREVTAEIDPAKTFLRIKKGSEDSFSRADQFRATLKWTLIAE